MKRLLLSFAILAVSLPIMSQKYATWHSSVTDRDYGVSAENVNGDAFDCQIYGQSLYKYIPVTGCRIASKDIPAFIKEMRALADKASSWWQTKAPVTGVEDAAIQFSTDFRNVTAWFDMAPPPDPEYHNMENAHVEAYTQMHFVGEGYVFLSVAPIVDNNGYRHPGFILPFGSTEDIEALISAIESLNP